MKSFPWYDSWWLSSYVRARHYISRHHPSRLDGFLQAMRPLHTRPDANAQLVEGLLSPAQFRTIEAAFRSVKPGQLELHETTTHGRFVVHDHPQVKEIQSCVCPALSELAGEALEPSYSFLSMYSRSGKCGVHLDAPLSKWTLDVCIEQSEPWPIHFSQAVPWPESFSDFEGDWENRIRSNPALRFMPYAMQPRQALFFSGSGQWHYRDPIPGVNPKAHCTLLFLHFVPAGARDVLVREQWESTFGVPGLTDAIMDRG